MNQLTDQIPQFFSENQLAFGTLLAWALVWKGVALWKAARANQKVWYIALLIINTLGLLEIVYLLFFVKKTEPATKP